MIGGIIKIVIGLFLWKVVPGWIEFGSSSARSFIQLIFNIIGVILVIVGAVNIVMSLI